MALGSRSGGAKARVSYLAGVGHRRRPGRGDDGSGVEGKGAPVVLGLGEGHDGVQEDTAELMAQAACSIVSGRKACRPCRVGEDAKTR